MKKRSNATTITQTVNLPFKNEDLKGTRREYLFGVPGPLSRFLCLFIKDERDVIMLYLMINIVCLMGATLFGLFWCQSTFWKVAFGLAHLGVMYGLFAQRFILMLHFSAHRGLFVKPLSLLNQLAPVVIAPFFGIPSGMYYLHHVIMHHIENNIFPWDVSSTMPYQRDNILHFLHYWLRFTLAAWLELPYYAVKRQRYLLAVGALSCCVSYMAIIYAVFRVDPIGALFAFIIPFIISSFALMFGNWSQHIFINPDSFADNYSLTYNCVNTIDNQYSFNDGYHIVHHAYSRLHWSEMPAYFMKHLSQYAEKDAFIFRDIGFFDLGVLVFTGRLQQLAKHYVHYGQVERSNEEIISEFQRRLQPIESN